MNLMKKEPEIQQVPLTSPDERESRIATLRRLFPDLFDGDGVLDEKALRTLLADEVPNVSERFRFEWAGKTQSKRFAFAPSRGTLRPTPEKNLLPDSSDTALLSKNVFIVGDNLEVLKLLEKSLFEKVSCIYIDPPYNADADVIYNDDYSETRLEYWERSGQLKEGIRLHSVTNTNGRRHSNWLNMMQPRVSRARHLLAPDGVIIVHIDDKELANLKKLMDEVYGEENFLGTVVWKNSTDNNPTRIAIEHEYILFYAKDINSTRPVWKANESAPKEALVAIGEELTKRYSDPTELQQAYDEWFSENRAYLAPLDRYKYIDRDGVYTGSQSVHNPGKEGYRYDVIHPDTRKPCKQPLMGYRFPKETMDDLLDKGKILFGDDENKIIELKVYAKDYKAKLGSVIHLDGRLGAYDLRALFPELTQPFKNPKPVSLAKDIIDFVTEPGDIVMDFFAGSGTTAHATYDLIADGQPRSFITIQLPEPISEKHEAKKAGYQNIADLTYERIVRASKKYTASKVDGDFGLTTFELTQSNFPENTFTPDPSKSEAENLKALDAHLTAAGQKTIFDDGNFGSVVAEIALKFGFGLFYKIQRLGEEFTRNAVYRIEGNDKGALLCLDEDLHDETIEALKAHGDEQLIVAKVALDTTKKFELHNAFKDSLWVV